MVPDIAVLADKHILNDSVDQGHIHDLVQPYWRLSLGDMIELDKYPSAEREFCCPFLAVVFVDSHS